MTGVRASAMTPDLGRLKNACAREKQAPAAPRWRHPAGRAQLDLATGRPGRFPARLAASEPVVRNHGPFGRKIFFPERLAWTAAVAYEPSASKPFPVSGRAGAWASWPACLRTAWLALASIISAVPSLIAASRMSPVIASPASLMFCMQ
jgi:hypothetical protein